MNIEEFRLTYVLLSVGLGLIILSPTLAMIIELPAGERFSELWILGPNRMAEDYPFIISSDVTYKIYLGVANRMSSLEYYMIQVKFRNQTETMPDSINGTPSTLEPLFEYRFILSDGEVWDKEFHFYFSDVSFEGNSSRVSKISIDNQEMMVEKTARVDHVNHGFYYQLFFELWIFDTSVSSFEYHNRFVGLWLNMTQT